MILSFEFIIGGYFSRIYQLTKTKNLSNIRRIAATCWLLSVDQTRNPLTNKLWLRTIMINSFIFKVTTLTPRPSARLSTSAQLTEPVASPSTASSAPTEPSSTRTTSSATGGSTLTAPLLRTSTALTMRSPLRGTLWPEPLTRPSMAPLPLSTPPLCPLPLPMTRPPPPPMTSTPPLPPPMMITLMTPSWAAMRRPPSPLSTPMPPPRRPGGAAGSEDAGEAAGEYRGTRGGPLEGEETSGDKHP